MSILQAAKRFHAALLSPGDARYCEVHRDKMPREGGGYLLTMGGMRRKWLCAACLAKASRRAA